MTVALVDTIVEDRPEADSEITHQALREAYERLTQTTEAMVALNERAAVPPVPKVVVKRAMPDREILAALNGLGAVLAVRLMLALAVVGAFFLAWTAMMSPSVMTVVVLVAYALTTVGPLTYLSTKRT